MFYSLFKGEYFLDLGNFRKSSYLYSPNKSQRKKIPQKDDFYLKEVKVFFKKMFNLGKKINRI